MNNSELKRNGRKLIIGYKYDPQSITLSRMHQIHCYEDSLQNNHKHQRNISFMKEDESIIKKLNQQIILLKSQINRLSSTQSSKMYQCLADSYNKLQRSNKKLVEQVELLKSQNSILKSKLKQLNQRYAKKVEQAQRNGHKKITFKERTSIQNLSDKIIQSVNGQKIDIPICLGNNNSSIHLPEFNFPVSQQSENSLHTYEQFYSSQSLQIKQQATRIKHQLLQGLTINDLYNNTRTLQSQKSQDIESQLIIHENFSFMPKKLVRNQTQKNICMIKKKVSFNAQNQYFSKNHQIIDSIIDINNTQANQNYKFNQNANNCLSKSNTNNYIAGLNTNNGLNGLRKIPTKSSKRLESVPNLSSIQE